MEVFINNLIDKFFLIYSFEIHAITVIWVMSFLLLYIVLCIFNKIPSTWLTDKILKLFINKKLFKSNIYTPEEIDDRFRNAEAVTIILMAHILRDTIASDMKRGYRTYDSDYHVNDICKQYKLMGGNSLTDDKFRRWERLELRDNDIDE